MLACPLSPHEGWTIGLHRPLRRSIPDGTCAVTQDLRHRLSLECRRMSSTAAAGRRPAPRPACVPEDLCVTTLGGDSARLAPHPPCGLPGECSGVDCGLCQSYKACIRAN